MLAGLAVTAAITRYWKISLHAGVASGTVTILTIVFGSALLLAGLLVAALGWSRVRLRDHTPLQAITGALVGATVAAVVFLPLT
jgi:membrane-associated phospholipid phosphatase